MATRAPRAASSRAVASPSPDAPPATNAPIPFSSIGPGRLPGRRECEPEQPGAVCEEVVEGEPGGVNLRGHGVAGELRADLGPDLLAVGEPELEAGAVD